MKNQLFGLNYELEQTGSALIFSRPQDALSEKDLVALEKKMLVNCPIAKLLPLQIIEIDQQIKLRYKIESRRSLRQITTQGNINKSSCFRILYAIVSTINDSKMYLLNEERYLLQEQFIYLGADETVVKLIYLPIQDLPDKATLQVELIQLLTFLLKNTEQILTPGEADIIQFLQSALFQLTELKIKLARIVTEMEPEQTIYHQHVNPAIIKKEQTQNSTKKDKPTLQWVHLNIKKQLLSSTIFSRYNPFLIVVSLFIFVIIWSFYLLLPAPGMFNLCLGISLLCSNIGLQLNRTIVTMETGELIQHQSNALTLQVNKPFNPKEQLDYYQQLSDQTTLLVPQDPTVLLLPPVKAYLEIAGEVNERIDITGDTFIIGRNSDIVQYKVDWIGVSRLHLEIKREGRDHEAKDLDSRNGSFLNNAPMIPQKSYSLVDGDCIKIVEKQILYKKV